MNYLIADISGKVLNYDIALCESISKKLPPCDHLKFLAANINTATIDCDCFKLISLIPKSLQNSECFIKRSFKALEGIVNYVYLILYLLLHKIDILHLQWLPFLEICSIEKLILNIIKVVSPKTKIVLTVHNLYPHNSSDIQKKNYRKRFNNIQKFIDKFILHLNVSRSVFCNDFSVDVARTRVIPHGIFEPKGVTIKPHKREKKLNLIMYGNQSYYKGTDILVDALAKLPQEYKGKVHTLIVGKISPIYLSTLKRKSKDLDILFIPEFVTDENLYRYINESDVIVLPYREISQSGVLLLALSFKRNLIVSDLPSFKETLNGLDEDIFFENGSASSLGEKLEKILMEKQEEKHMTEYEKLEKKYSWSEIAIQYKCFYETLCYE